MSPDPNAPIHLVIPEAPSPRRRWRPLAFGLGLLGVIVVGLVVRERSGFRMAGAWSRANPTLRLVRVDRGELTVYVTENGTLESANNATVRCKVEALIGQVGGAAGVQVQGRPGGTGGGGRGGQGGPGGAPGQGGGQGQPAPVAKKAQGPKGRPGARKPAGGAAAKAQKDGVAAAPAAGATGAAGAAGTAGGGAAAGGTATAAADGTVAASPKPVIRSFAYRVLPYVPLRPKAPTPQAQPKAVDPALMAGGGGGRRGGGGNAQLNEKPGATRVLSILPEGTRVQAGDVVCELDAAAFRDELQAQYIRYIQAEAWVKQAQSILEVNEISWREYREGIYPQDSELIRQYIATCTTQYDQARQNAEWGRGALQKGVRSNAQYKADLLSLQQTETALREARGMAFRLETYTGPKLLKSLEAKSEAIRSDKLAQEAAFQIESDRKKKLETMVENCTMRAPRDGIVVYFTQSNGWGRVDNQIQEGVTVREGQPIFNLPDPKHMQVKARVNETKVAFLRRGQPALIRIDAFPDRPLHGTITEITAIPAPGSGPGSDVRVYFATVTIDEGGFDDLRPGLSAEVDFPIDDRRDTTRVPLQALREFGGKSYAAVAATPTDRGQSWRWTPVTIGLADETFAEVLDGLKPGDQVVANPEALPAPAPTAPAKAAPPVATASLGPRD